MSTEPRKLLRIAVEAGNKLDVDEPMLVMPGEQPEDSQQEYRQDNEDLVFPPRDENQAPYKAEPLTTPKATKK